jgi:hypothetical protein
MAKCALCQGNGCDSCGGRGYVTDCKLKEHWGEISGKRYPLVLDKGSGRHRFKANRVVRDMLDAASAGRKFDLNDVACKHEMKEYTTLELLEFYQLIGYSMGGLAELDYFQGFKMDTCEWKKAEVEKGE